MYRRKEVVEAVRWDGSKKNAHEIIQWARGHGRDDLSFVMIGGDPRIVSSTSFMASPGDWVAYRDGRIIAHNVFTFENFYDETPND